MKLSEPAPQAVRMLPGTSSEPLVKIFDDEPVELDGLIYDRFDGNHSTEQRLLQYLYSDYSPGKSGLYD